jgi:Cys-tRNA(Pro)/Cys-tRNA(Cys) deacylase
LKLEESSIVKTILFDAKDGSDLFMALVSGNATVKSSVLKKLVGSKNVTLASPERVSETTGYQIGSIPPFGWITSGFRVFIDKALLAVPEVGVGSGQWGVEILLSPSDLVRVTGAIPF